MLIDKKEILLLTKELLPALVKLRRDLHRRPEVSNLEIRTTGLLKSELARHHIKMRRLRMKTGALAIINSESRPVIAIRTDIDALPVAECTRLPYRSQNDGVMHACGHDIHMAVVLGTAILLNRLRGKIPGCIKFIFQPAEESPPGGAKQLIKEGVLHKPDVDMIFGLHVDPMLDVGKIGLRNGPTMAAVYDIDITIIGRGGHAAAPHRTVDAVSVAAEVIESIQKIVSRETNPLKPIVITFGLICGGTVRNVIADRVHLSGTARTLDSENIPRIPALIKRTVDGICRARGAKYKIEYQSGYPVLSNDDTANGILKNAFTDLFGRKSLKTSPQSMGGEDFSFFLEEIPGAVFQLGVRNNKINANKPLHSPEFIADEKSIFYGTALMSYAVFKYFESL